MRQFVATSNLNASKAGKTVHSPRDRGSSNYNREHWELKSCSHLLSTNNNVNTSIPNTVC